MGFFSADKTVSVSSVVYNLAGDVTQRPNYLQGLVLRNVLSGTKLSIADSIIQGELAGPGIQLRAFYRWAAYQGEPDHYRFIGMCSGSIQGLGTVSDALVTEAVSAAVTLDPNQELTVDSATAGFADYSFWAERWMGENHPDLIESEWVATFAPGSAEITVTLEDGTVSTFVPEDYDTAASYLYAAYSIATTNPTYDADGNQTGEETVQGPPQVFIYRIGSGNADLDALAEDAKPLGQFFPMIPVRINSNFLSPQYFNDAYREAKKAYKKLTNGGKFDELVDKVADNKDLDDIDYTYVSLGVSLNVIEKSCKRYLYEFFSLLMQGQRGGPSGPSGGLVGGTNSIRITNTGPFFTGYDMRLEWGSIRESFAQGQGRPGARRGDLWFETLAFGQPGTGDSTMKKAGKFPGQGGHIRLYWQTGDNSHRYLDIRDLVHRNFIYGNYAIVITGPEALADGEESGFIVPLHYETFRQTPLVHATQMATACCFLVFNCFQVRRQRWYEVGIFQVLIVVAIAVVSAVLTGGTTVGLLGTALAVGTSLGLTGITAAIVGAVVNALAALVLVSIIEKAATAVFGPTIGQLIAAIAVIVIGNVASNFQATGQLAVNWGDFMRADNLMKLTQAAGKAWETEIQLETQRIVRETELYAKDLQGQLGAIQRQYLETFGAPVYIDPTWLTDSGERVLNESRDTFLTRTLMTGSDIATLSNDLLTNFAEYTTKLPDAFT
jgi:hypothetical protein